MALTGESLFGTRWQMEGRSMPSDAFADREQTEFFQSESQGQNLALTVLYVPYSLYSGSAETGDNVADKQMLAWQMEDKSMPSDAVASYLEQNGSAPLVQFGARDF